VQQLPQRVFSGHSWVADRLQAVLALLPGGSVSHRLVHRRLTLVHRVSAELLSRHTQLAVVVQAVCSALRPGHPAYRQLFVNHHPAVPAVPCWYLSAERKHDCPVSAVHVTVSRWVLLERHLLTIFDQPYLRGLPGRYVSIDRWWTDGLHVLLEHLRCWSIGCECVHHHR
jgi:hypothetical protein